MDVALIETLDGGDTQQNGNDFATVIGFENTIYMALFGGNPGHVTKVVKEGEEYLYWWGNEVLMANEPTQQMNSYTEYTLMVVALNSAGRISIEEAIKKDLIFLQKFGKVIIEVSIVSDDRISVLIKLIIPNGQSKVTIVNFTRQPNGDFYFGDFDKTDFYI